MPAVLITGCSSGFGRLSALAFARLGWRVVATMRTPAAGRDLLDIAAAASWALSVVALDVTDPASVDAAVAEASAAGPLDAVVNNAGVELHGPVHLASADEVRWQFDANVFGLLTVVRAVVPGMRAAGGGVIVNVGSLAGYVGAPYTGVYAATKHAVSALTEAMHFELSHEGIRTVLVEPGQFPTRLGANARVVAALEEGSPEAARRERWRAAQRSLAGPSPADPQQVADAIVRAATDPACPLHLLVGGDAELVAGAKRSLPFEEFEAVMRATLDWRE